MELDGNFLNAVHQGDFLVGQPVRQPAQHVEPRIAESFVRQPLMATLGARLVHAGYDETGRLVGLALPARAMGYQDQIHALYGYSPEQEAIVGLRVLESRETPGLGDRIDLILDGGACPVGLESTVIALLGGWWLGWTWLDPLMGVIGAVIIAVWAKGLLLETGKVLLDREMDSPLVARVRSALVAEPDTELADLHLWRVGRSQFACIASVVTHGNGSADRYKARLQGIGELVHVTVEVNRCAENGHTE